MPSRAVIVTVIAVAVALLGTVYVRGRGKGGRGLQGAGRHSDAIEFTLTFNGKYRHKGEAMRWLIYRK